MTFGEKSLAPARRLDLTLAAVALAAYAAAFLPAWKALVLAWYGSEDYSHGFVIVPMAAYVLWHRREDLRRTPAAPSWTGLPVILAALGLYLFGLFAGVWTMAYLALVLAVAGSALFLFGIRMVRESSFALLLLLFMVPVPAQIYTWLTAPLQLLVSQATAGVLHLLQIPVWREGNILHLPNHSFQVIQACSGLRSVMALVTVGLLLGYFTLRSNGLRAVLFAAGVPVAILVNIVRVLLMVLGFHFFGIDLTEGELHTSFGLAIFALALVLLYLLRGVLAKWDRSRAAG